MAVTFSRSGLISASAYTCVSRSNSSKRNFIITTGVACIKCATRKFVGNSSVVPEFGNAVLGAKGSAARATSVFSAWSAAVAPSIKQTSPSRDYYISRFLSMPSSSSLFCRLLSSSLSRFSSSSRTSSTPLVTCDYVAEGKTNVACSDKTPLTLQQQRQSREPQQQDFEQEQKSQETLQEQQHRKNHDDGHRGRQQQQQQQNQQGKQQRKYGETSRAAALLAVSPVLFTEWDKTSDPKNELMFLAGNTLGYCTEKFFENEYGQSIFACVLGLVYLALLGYEGKINGAVWRMKHVFGTNMKLVGHPRYSYALPKNPLLCGSQTTRSK